MPSMRTAQGLPALSIASFGIAPFARLHIDLVRSLYITEISFAIVEIGKNRSYFAVMLGIQSVLFGITAHA